MAAVTDELRYLNPFLTNRVEERTIWGEGGEPLEDIARINQGPFDTMIRDLELVRGHPDHLTRVRFIIGAAGSGKSHLFSRLRRRVAGEAVFAFAANPPIRPEGVLSWMAGQVIFGAKHAHIDGGPRPYTQLHVVLYSALQPAFGFSGSLDEFHAHVKARGRKALRRAIEYLERELPFDTELARALAYIIMDDASDVAFRWLAGSTNISDDELALIGQKEYLAEGAQLRLFGLLGQLAARANLPLLLVLDQLDLMTSREQVDEFQRILFGLLDDSRNWYVVISLIQDKFDVWRGLLSEALRTRLDSDGQQLPLAELEALGDVDEKRELMLTRLASPQLVAIRRRLGIQDDIYPLTRDDLVQLTRPERTYARSLLTEAGRLYAARTNVEPHRVSLDTVVGEEFEKARRRLDEQPLEVDRAVLADRLVELVEVVCAGDARPFSRARGPLESRANFKGTDDVLTVGGRPVRLLGHHVQQGPQFPDFLRRVMSEAPGTILIRDGAVPVSGRVTSERLAEFQKDKVFIHLPRTEILDAYALGHVLAEMREGGFSGLAADVPATELNIKRRLGRIPCLAQSAIARTVLGIADGDYAAPPAPRMPPAPPAASGLVGAIRAIVRKARWLVLARHPAAIELPTDVETRTPSSRDVESLRTPGSLQ